MNHQAIIDQLSSLAPQLKAASSPEDVLVKYAQERNLAAAQLERIGQIYNIAKTLNFMDKAANRGDSFRVLDVEKMLSDYTSFKVPEASHKGSVDNNDWSAWLDVPGIKAAATKGPSLQVVEKDNAFFVYSGESALPGKYTTIKEANDKLAQIEYLQACKEAHIVPNILAMARTSTYSPCISDTSVEPLPGTSAPALKSELSKEAFIKFELDSAAQAAHDAEEEMRKVAEDLLALHRIEPLPFATMEHDAVYSATAPLAIKAAVHAVAKYFASRGWSVERHDFSKAASKLVRDRHNVLPLFQAVADAAEIKNAALAYKEYFEKEASTTVYDSRYPNAYYTGNRGQNPKKKPSSANEPESNERAEEKVPGGLGDPPTAKERQKPDVTSEDALNSLLATLKAPQEDGKQDGSSGKGVEEARSIIGGAAKAFSPASYMGDQTKDFLAKVLKSPDLAGSNNRQRKVDAGVDDLGRITGLQRLLLSDPIIGEADPDTVLSLYNTLARANPEVVKDNNLLRFALREALQYDAVPLHTYKDLISMGKDRADSSIKNMDIANSRYRL